MVPAESLRPGPIAAPAPSDAPTDLSALRHELRGALAALLVAVDVLEAASPGSREGGEALQVVRRQARRLSGMVSELTQTPQRPQGAAPARRRGRRVLLALRGDAGAGPERLARALEREGHEVQVAEDGIAALRALLELQPEVSLIDLDLAGLPGLAVARHARAAGHTGWLAGVVDPARCDMPRLRAHGFDTWLPHPLEPRELGNWIRGLHAN